MEADLAQKLADASIKTFHHAVGLRVARRTQAVCAKLSALGIAPTTVIEPTCGVGAFVLAALSAFPTL